MIEYIYNLHGIFKFRISAKNAKKLDYLNREFSSYKTTENVELDLDLFIGTPDITRHGAPIVTLENRKYSVTDDTITVNTIHKLSRFTVTINGISNPKTTIYLHNDDILSQRLFVLRFFFPIMRLKLVQKGYALVKASSISLKQDAFVFAGSSGSGKTSIVLHSLEHGFKFMSDTFSIVSKQGVVYPICNLIHIFERNLHSCPFIVHNLSIKDKLELSGKRLISLISMKKVNISQMCNPQDLFHNSLCKKPLKLRTFVLLAIGDYTEILLEKIVDTIGFVDRLVFLDMLEAHWFNQLGYAFSHVNPQNAFQQCWIMQRKILMEALQNCDCLEIKFDGNKIRYKDIVGKITKGTMQYD